MPFSVSTWNYLNRFGEKADFNCSLARIRSQGFGVELWLDWYADRTTFHRSNWETVKELCHGLPSLSAHTGQIHRFSLPALIEEMDLCAYIGADPLVCHPGSLGLKAGIQDLRSNMLLNKEDRDLIGVILSEASGRSLRLALENGPLDLLQQVLEAMADHPCFGQLGICIDTGHANMHG